MRPLLHAAVWTRDEAPLMPVQFAFFFFQAEDGIRDWSVTGVQTCALPICLACEGADVAICYRKNKKGADEVVERITEMKRRAAAFQADVGNISDGQRFIEEAVANLGKIDILVNNAGLEKRADFWDVTEADFDAVLNVNLKGMFFVTQAVVRHLRQTNRPGKIINITSVHEELP